MNPRKPSSSRDVREEILHHWREAVPNDRLAHLVRDCGRACVRALQLRLAEHDVSFGHWTFLRVLWVNDRLTQRDLSARAGVTEPTAFAALRAMEERGLIARHQAPDNRKNVYIVLTAKGRALRKTLEPLAEEVNRIAVTGVPAKDIAATRNTLLAIIENLAQDEIASSR
jgi:DNA-binding MarR family transcriptional regulator